MYKTEEHSKHYTSARLLLSSKPTNYTNKSFIMSDIPQGDAQDNDYVSRPGQKEAGIPVQSDDAPVEDPIDAEVANSDEQLGMFQHFSKKVL